MHARYTSNLCTGVINNTPVFCSICMGGLMAHWASFMYFMIKCCLCHPFAASEQEKMFMSLLFQCNIVLINLLMLNHMK